MTKFKLNLNLPVTRKALPVPVPAPAAMIRRQLPSRASAFSSESALAPT